MVAHGLPILATLLLWWASTGLILRLDSLERRTFAASMLGATALLAVSLWLAARTSGQATPGAAYVAFAAGLVAWGWQLLAFYTGYVTGPRKIACAPDSGQLSRFLQAVSVSLYHELAGILGALALFVLTYGQPNSLAFWTYLVLWAMHTSAKLNVFLGVPNLGEEMLPDHLAYLTSYMTRRPMNVLFPASVTAGTILVSLLFLGAIRTDATSFEVTRDSLLAALTALAVAEHWFLVAPIDGSALWRVFRRRSASSATQTAPAVKPAEIKAPTTQSHNANEPSESAWTAVPPPVCDKLNVERLLESIRVGSFGEVDCMEGIVRTKADWVRFELSGGRASMATFYSPRLQKPLVTARGRGFDRARLQAAFDDCAAFA